MDLKIIIPGASKLQLRVLAAFQQIAAQFKSNIRVRKGDFTADAKSFMEIIGLLDAHGNELEITAEGEDALAALEAIQNLARKGAA